MVQRKFEVEKFINDWTYTQWCANRQTDFDKFCNESLLEVGSGRQASQQFERFPIW